MSRLFLTSTLLNLCYQILISCKQSSFGGPQKVCTSAISVCQWGGCGCVCGSLVFPFFDCCSRKSCCYNLCVRVTALKQERQDSLNHAATSCSPLLCRFSSKLFSWLVRPAHCSQFTCHSQASERLRENF